MKWRMVVMLIMIAVWTAGCGGPKADVKMFLIVHNGMDQGKLVELNDKLAAVAGDAASIEFNASPVFSQEKLIVELAAGENSIVIVPKQEFDDLTKLNGFMNLDEIASPEHFPQGVVENTEIHEKHLYAIPLNEVEWFAQGKYVNEEVYAFIPVNLKEERIAKAKQVLGKIVSE